MKMCLLVFVVVLLVPSLVASQDCIDYRDYLRLLGWDLATDTGVAYGIAVSGNYAYVATHCVWGLQGLYSGFHVFRIDDPRNPLDVAHISLADTAYSVDVSGNYAYVAAGTLEVIDITDPSSPEIVGSAGTPGFAVDVAVAHTYAYVAAGNLVVFDIADPTSPQLVRVVSTPGDANSVVVFNTYAYVADGDGGLQIIDILDPTNPEIIGNVATPGTAKDVAVSGNHACVADGDLHVIDIENPASPQLVGSVGAPGVAWGVAVKGNCAFVVSSYVGSSLHVIDFTNPESPELIGSLDTVGYWAMEVAVSDDYAYVAWSDRAGPDGPYYGGLQIVDVSNPELPPIIGGVDTPGFAVDVVVSGDHAYVADGESGLVVVNVTDPESPSIVGYADTPTSGYSFDVEVSDNYLYALYNDLNDELILVVIDIAEPENPHILGALHFFAGTVWSGSMAITGNYAFFTDTGADLQVVSIADPENPHIVGSLDTPGYAQIVAVSENYAYVGTASISGPSGLHVVKISVPECPEYVSTVSEHRYVIGVAVSGDYICYAVRSVGPLDMNLSRLYVADVANPHEPEQTGNVILTGDAQHGGVAFSGDIAYVAVGSGLQVIDITAPFSPQIIGSSTTPGSASHVVVSGDYVYVADGDSGLQIMPAQCDDSVAIEDDPEETTPDDEVPCVGVRLAVHPNPFNPQTTITFSLERDEWASVGVYELTGRRVTLLADRTFDAGTHSLTWSGRDEAGRSMPSGTYLVRLETESAVRAQKLMLLR